MIDRTATIGYFENPPEKWWHPAQHPRIHRATDGAFEGPGAHPAGAEGGSKWPVLETKDGREWIPHTIKHGPWLDATTEGYSSPHSKTGRHFHWDGEPREVVFRHGGHEQQYRVSWFELKDKAKRVLRYKDAA